MRGSSKVRRVLVAAVFAAGAAGGALAQGTIRQGLGSPSLFPLREGNSWTYARKGLGGTAEWTVRVNSKISAPRVHPYFVLEGYFAGPPHSVRSDPFGTVTERSDGFRDHLWFLLGAPAGTSWTLQLAPSPVASPIADCISGAKLTLAARGETVSVPAGEFEGVVRVDWVSSCADAGITSEWFAPGVGLIRREESSFAGVVRSDLIRAELGGTSLPRIGYVTSLSVDRPLYAYNLMPPVDPEAFPTVTGALTLHKRPDQRLVLTFAGCKSVSLAVVNEAGETVLATHGDDGGCCECDVVIEWDFSRGPLVVPFSFKLVGDGGQPLPDGRYAVSAMLDTVDPEPIRPAARATIDIASAH